MKLIDTSGTVKAKLPFAFLLKEVIDAKGSEITITNKVFEQAISTIVERIIDGEEWCFEQIAHPTILLAVGDLDDVKQVWHGILSISVSPVTNPKIVAEEILDVRFSYQEKMQFLSLKNRNRNPLNL